MTRKMKLQLMGIILMMITSVASAICYEISSELARIIALSANVCAIITWIISLMTTNN